MSQKARIILIVDDSPEDRVLYQRYLQRDSNYDYTFLEASSGRQGLELWQQQPVDAILLDYRLPDLDGLAFLAQLHSVPRAHCVPVIVLTGQGSEAIAVQAMKAGAQDYLVKGEIIPEKLHLAMNAAIETVQLQTQVQQQLEQQRLIMAMTQRIRQSLNLEDILQTTVDEVRQFLQVDRVILFEFSPTWGGAVTVESVADPALAILPISIYDPCIGETYVEPFKQGLVTAKTDIYTADISPCHVEFLAQFQVRANLVVPILQKDELWGLLVAHNCKAPRPWQDSEIYLLQQLAAQVSVALQQAALFQQVQTELLERRQVEAALRQSEYRYRSLFESIDEGFCVIEMVFDANNTPYDYRFLEANPAFEQQSGLEQAVGKTARQLMPDLEDHWFEIFGRVALTGEPIRFENGAAPLNRWFDLYAFRLEHPSSSKVGIVFKDITQRKQAELALQSLNVELEQRVAERTAELTALNDRLLVAFKDQSQTEAALRESEERRRLALDMTQIGAWDFHIPTGQVIWDDTSFTLLGLSPGAVEASYDLWRTHVHPDDVVSVEQQFQQAIATRTEFSTEYRVIHADGSVHWLMVRARGTYDEAGEPLRVLGTWLEISDRKQAEATLQQQTRQEQLRWHVTQAIRQSLDLNAILSTAVAEVRQTLQADRVAVYRFQPDWSGDFIVESVGEGWIKLVNPDVQKVWEDTHLQDTQGGRFQRHETFVISDIYTAGLHSCHIDLLEQFQAKAYAVAPIFSGSTLWGLLAIYQNATPRQWQDWEIELLQQIASQLSIAIQQSELYGQLQVELKDRQQATAVIREAERRWRSLLDNVQLLVVGVDQRVKINYVNAFFLNLTGYTEAEVIGKSWFEQFLPPSIQATIQTVFSEVLTQGAHPYYQNVILTKAGEERCIAWNNTMLQDANGNSTGIISIGEDITERQRVEKMKNEFISIVSHELRTPLTSIRGSLGLLATGVMDDEPDAMKHMITIAATDTERLVRLVNDVLDLEKLESGKISFVREWCNAADLMQRSIEVMQSSAQAANVQLIVQPLSLQIWVDPDRIIQTFTNLLSNAIKFSPPGSTIWLKATRDVGDARKAKDAGDTKDATQRSERSNVAAQSAPQTSNPSNVAAQTVPLHPTPYVLFSVTDQGRGIPADKLESIFNRFQQVDASDSRDQGGTGLGLAICQSIVQQHDGDIWVESCWGQGSTFFFSLPLQKR
ncbi:MAG: GAF domain-containing protein [Leptolyngbya sp. BL-A-14]